MLVPASGERAAHQPLLWPDAKQLKGLAEFQSASVWESLRYDPTALLWILRHQPDLSSPLPSNFLASIRGNSDEFVQWVDWAHPAVMPVYRTALAIAHFAEDIARITSCIQSTEAWTAGLLAPLGWFDVAARDSTRIAECLSDPLFQQAPLETQRRLWRHDHLYFARRLAKQWALPNWLSDAIANSGSPTNPALFAVVQTATILAESSGHFLGLRRHFAEQELFGYLGLAPNDLVGLRERFQTSIVAEAFEANWRESLEDPDIVQAIPDDEERLKNAKLTALAEFAAGASHEINNPLAVISGQSQYLLNREVDERKRKSLQSIQRQTQRVHAILSELMQFARPARPVPQRLAVAETLRSVVESYRQHADDAGVALECQLPDETLTVVGDSRHLRTAVGCLVRNAIEAAAPDKGWARLHVRSTNGQIEIIVEDSGMGPTSDQRPHMFDPFYSGRSAGRGRGLGLPTAWRLAREQGGDVRFVPVVGGPTRFILSLPLHQRTESRMSA